MKTRKKERKLTRLILAAILSTGGLAWSPTAQAAEDTNVNTNMTISDDQSLTGTGGYKLTGTGITFTVANTGKIKYVTSTYDGNIFNLESDGTITGGVSNALYGGAKNNTLNLYGTVTKGQIYGGTINGNSEISGNKVNIFSGANIASFVYGGYSGNDNTVTNNTVTITGGALTGTTSTGTHRPVYGGYSASGTATNNTVTISGDTTNIEGSVYGGGTNSGTVTGNTVNIDGGTIGGSVYGGYSDSGNATGNTVNIDGGTINGNVVGGYVGGTGSATGNTINVSSVENITGGLYASQAFMGGTTSGNIVNILGTINISGWLDGDGTQTINIASKNNIVGNLYSNPEQLNFYLPTDMTTSDVMLTVNGDAEVDGTKVGVKAQGKLANLAKDDKVTLLSAGTLKGTVTQTTEIDVPTGLNTVDTYEFSVTSENNNIYATITKDSSSDDTTDTTDTTDNTDSSSSSSSGGSATSDAQKSVVETRAAAVTLLNAGADMLASQGFAQAANAVALEAAEQAKNAEPGVAAPVANAFTPFAAFGGSSMRAESGSHVDTKGFGINVGFAKEFSNSQGKLLFGPVVEYGGGNYDSYNNDVHGDGKSHYWGIGLMARQVNHDGFYYEGSVRGGRVTSDYSANIANNAGGTTRASYDSKSNYWAAHLGLGKVFAAGKKGTVDGYLKYFYSHQAGDDTDIRLATATGEGTQHVSFDSVNSHRVRVGARYTHKVNERNSFYGGLAYQYEFGGEARAHYGGVGEAPSPSVKGSSGMLELGWQVKPGGPVTIDLGVTGWAGKQRGGSVQLGATWSF